jgi:hypothetical protein
MVPKIDGKPVRITIDSLMYLGIFMGSWLLSIYLLLYVVDNKIAFWVGLMIAVVLGIPGTHLLLKVWKY